MHELEELIDILLNLRAAVFPEVLAKDLSSVVLHCSEIRARVRSAKLAKIYLEENMNVHGVLSRTAVPPTSDVVGVMSPDATGWDGWDPVPR